MESALLDGVTASMLELSFLLVHDVTEKYMTLIPQIIRVHSMAGDPATDSDVPGTI